LAAALQVIYLRKLSERLLPIRRVLRSGEPGQPAGSAETSGGELPLWLVSSGGACVRLNR
jgi:hypothetical protein